LKVKVKVQLKLKLKLSARVCVCVLGAQPPVGVEWCLRCFGCVSCAVLIWGLWGLSSVVWVWVGLCRSLVTVWSQFGQGRACLLSVLLVELFLLNFNLCAHLHEAGATAAGLGVWLDRDDGAVGLVGRANLREGGRGGGGRGGGG
jgi:hypothetical protein